MRVTIYHIVQTELTHLTILWTLVFQTTVNLTVINTTLSILALAVAEVVVSIIITRFLQIKKPSDGI